MVDKRKKVWYNSLSDSEFIMDLRKMIEENWDNSSFIALSLNKTIRESIIEETKFLDRHYDKIQLRSRAYCIKNGINESNLPQCKCNCGKPAGLNYSNAIKGFRIYCGPECHRKDEKVPKDVLDRLSDYKWMYNQRVNLKKSFDVIAAELGVSHIPVVKWMKIHGIKNVIKNLRVVQEDKLELLKNKDLMVDLYLTQELTMKEVCEKIGVGNTVLTQWFKKHKIIARKPNEYKRKKNFVSKAEKEIKSYIKKFISEDKFILNDRRLLKGKELDILIPHLNLAIEYDGIFSHIYRPNEEKDCLKKDENYHLNKTITCLDQGIQLIHLFSSEWERNKRIARGLIRKKLLKNDRIFAKDCYVKKLTKNAANKFLKSNCIEGELSGDFDAIGLFYNNSLVKVFCYKNSEIIRTASRIGISIVGGFKKLLDEFKKDNSTIYCYVNRRFSNGNLLKSYGFVIDEIIEPKYYYTNKSYDELFDAELIETECIGKEDYCFYCEKPQYKKIFDCGYLKFKLQ